ncbi:MAG: hypothetical protein WEB52_03370 [Dehalococcoidia bacterium]
MTDALWPRLWVLTMAILFAFWSMVVVTVTVTAALTMRPGEHDAPAVTPEATSVAPPRRPARVPLDANLVTTDLLLGDATPPAGTPVSEQHIFYTLRCDGDVLTVTTTREIVYARVECARYRISDDVVRPFLGEPVRVMVDQGDIVIASFMTIAGGTLRFDAEGVWLQTLERD